jgi:hypothetical protein
MSCGKGHAPEGTYGSGKPGQPDFKLLVLKAATAAELHAKKGPAFFGIENTPIWKAGDTANARKVMV